MVNFECGQYGMKLRCKYTHCRREWREREKEKIPRTEPLKAIVIAINIIFFCATEWLLFISPRSPSASDLNSSRFQFYFQLLINHNISFRCMLLMIVWPSSRLWIYLRPMTGSCCVAIYGKWICFCLLRALMCKPLNNHKKSSRTEQIIIYIGKRCGSKLAWQTTDNSQQTNQKKFKTNKKQLWNIMI